MSNVCRHCDPVVKRWSKRFRATISFLFLNFVTFWMSMYEGVDVMEISKALVILNGPLYAYLWAESYKPSKEIIKDEIHS